MLVGNGMGMSAALQSGTVTFSEKENLMKNVISLALISGFY